MSCDESHKIASIGHTDTQWSQILAPSHDSSVFCANSEDLSKTLDALIVWAKAEISHRDEAIQSRDEAIKKLTRRISLFEYEKEERIKLAHWGMGPALNTKPNYFPPEEDPRASDNYYKVFEEKLKLLEELKVLKEMVKTLQTKEASYLSRIRELEEKVSCPPANSGNTNFPPSMDPYKKGKHKRKESSDALKTQKGHREGKKGIKAIRALFLTQILLIIESLVAVKR
jgi:hypothetical protein